MQVGVLIVGAGPTGLGVATRLQQRGHMDWALIERVLEEEEEEEQDALHAALES
jgi:2-polyprenyl-6-methoxyphenol hydroxylase-like FAD-dependent oxidoreductase